MRFKGEDVPVKESYAYGLIGDFFHDVKEDAVFVTEDYEKAIAIREKILSICSGITNFDGVFILEEK